jgi:DNA polymerase-3 subunit epsilon
MIVFDTETTGLIESTVIPLGEQPRIIEFAAQKLHDVSLKEKDRLQFLVNPGIPLPDFIEKATGITDADLVGAKPFASHFDTLAEFFLGERVMVAHNLAFDSGMLEIELRRLERTRHFPWPYSHKCTVEISQYFKGHYLNLDKLHEALFDELPKGTRHRAMADVKILVKCVRELRIKAMI